MMKESKDAVSCLLVYPCGKIIVQEHAKTGMITIPSGGRELGESPDEAIVRELKEELGVDVDPSQFVSVELVEHPAIEGMDSHREFRYVLPITNTFEYYNAEPEKHPWMGAMHPDKIKLSTIPFTQILTSVLSKIDNGEYKKYMTV